MIKQSKYIDKLVFTWASACLVDVGFADYRLNVSLAATSLFLIMWIGQIVAVRSGGIPSCILMAE